MKRIKAYVGMDEVNKVQYYRNFEVIDFMPEVGDSCFGEEIKEIIPVSIDIEQGNDEAFNYDYFHVITTENKEFDKENDVYCERWYAIEHPMLRVEFHYWKEGSGYSHSEIFDNRFVGEFTSIENSAKEYFENYDGDLRDELEPDEAINIEIYNDDNKLVSEYWVDCNTDVN